MNKPFLIGRNMVVSDFLVQCGKKYMNLGILVCINFNYLLCIQFRIIAMEFIFM